MNKQQKKNVENFELFFIFGNTLYTLRDIIIFLFFFLIKDEKIVRN